MIDLRELQRIKKTPWRPAIILRSEMDGLRSEIFWGEKGEQCDCSITDYGRHILTFLGFFLTLGQYQLIYLTRSATLRFTENKFCLKKPYKFKRKKERKKNVH